MRRQMTMLGRIIKRDRPVLVRTTFRNVSRKRQGSAHDAMPDHPRNGGSLFLSKCQEMGREIAHRVAIECPNVSEPKAKEDGEQQQWVFGRFSERLSPVDQLARPLHSRRGFRRGKSFEVNEWGYERDLKSDLLAAQRGRSGQSRDLG